MMTDQPAGERPGHLDVDAVSAFIDRDLHPDDVTAVELHLAVCPACQREVLEIHTTVLLLAALPQYAPRRSFLLTSAHARAARLSGLARGLPWTGQLVPHGYPAPAAARIAADRYAGAFAGLHAAALVIGALLLLVASSDFLGMPPQPAALLREESAPAAVSESAPPPAAPFQAPAARVASAPNASLMVTATAFAAEASYGMVSEARDGTTGDIPTSQGLETTADEAPAAPSIATTSIAAAVVQARPTAAASLGRGTAGESQESAGAATEQPLQGTSEPSRLRLVEIALAFGLAWLIVTITGLRWVRRVR
jgi:hypothetical protein